MQLEYTNGFFYCIDCSYDQRIVPKAAGFIFYSGDVSRAKMNVRAEKAGVPAKSWCTDRAELASKLVEYATPTAKSVIQDALSESHATDSNIEIPVPKGLAYRPFQKAGIAYAIKRKHTIIADEMGLGKSIQGVGYLNAMGDAAYPALFLCPASLKLNWERELGKWLVNPVKVQVIKSGSDVIASDAKIVIANYDLSIRRTDNGEYHVADALCTFKWSTLVLDEAHYLKNESAKRTVAILGQRKSKKVKKEKEGIISRPGIVENSGHVLALTGTPIQNKPIEIFPLLHALYPETYSSYWDFAKKYNGAYQEVIGYGRFAKTIWKLGEPNNLGELQEMLRLKCMVRRLKSEVLKELPPKIRQIITLETDDATKKLVLAENEALRGYNERIVEIEAELARIMEQAEDAKSGGDSEAYNKAKAAYEEIANTMFAKKDIDITTVTKMRVKLAKAKLPYAIEHIDNSLESSKKIVVFAVHHEVIDALMEHYEDRAVKIDGRDSINDRQLAVDRFQNDENVTVFVGNIKAAGVGLTLTAASHVIFVELDWVPANLVQAEDRCHRMGNRDAVLVQHLVLQGSLDEHFVRVVMEKQNMFDAAMDEEVVKDTSMIPALPADKPKSDGPIRFDDVVLGVPAISLVNIDNPTMVLKSILESIQGIFLSGDRAIGKELMAKDEFSDKDTATAMMFVKRYQAFLTEEQKKKVGI